MRSELTTHVVLLLAASSIAAILAVCAWRRRPALGAGPFAWAQLAVACWSLAYVMALASSDLSSAIFWTRFQYLGITLAPVAVLALALEYTGRESWLTRGTWLMLAIVPVLSILLVWTNDFHHGFFKSQYLDSGDPFPVLASTAGPWFWVHAAYAYLVLLAAVSFLLDAFLRSPPVYRGQTIALLIAVLTPLVANALYLSDLDIFTRLDPTPFAFTVSGLVIAWGLFRFQLFDIVPVARDAVIESMCDGVIVLDAHNRVIDLNPAAQRISGHTTAQVVGQPATAVLPASPELVERFGGVVEAHTEVSTGAGNNQRVFDLRISPLYDRHGDFSGRLIVFRDITQRKQADAALSEAEQRFRTIFENAAIGLYRATPGGRILLANPALIDILGYESFEELAQHNLREAGFEPDFPRAQFKQRIADEGQIIGLESAWIRRDDTVRYVRENARAIRDDAGNTLYYEGTVEDITERRQVEEALRERERFLALLNDITRVALETPDLPTMFQTLAARLGKVIGADACYLTLWDDTRQITIPTAAPGAWSEAYPSLSLEPGELTLTESVLRAGHPLVVEDLNDTPCLSRRFAELFPERSLLGLPLIAGDQKLGAAIIAFNESHQFTPEEIARGEQAARQIALAIAQTRLLEQAYTQWHEADTLRQAASAVSETLSLHETLERILVQLEEVVPYDSASIQLMRDGYMEIMDGRGFPDRDTVIGVKFPVPGDNPNTTVVTARSPVILADAPEAFPSFRDAPHGHIRSWLGVPLTHHDRLIGILAVDSAEPGHFTNEHIRLIIPFANQAAIAIENARLYEESQRLVRELTGLYDAALATSSALETDTLLHRLHDEVQRLMVPDTFVVVLCDAKANEFQVAMAEEEGKTLADIVGKRFSLDAGGLTAWVMRQREPLLVRDMEADSLPAEPRHGPRPARSWLGVPLVARNQLLGAISVQSFQPNAFGEADGRFLESLATQTAIAIENARLVEALRQYTIELEARNEELDAFAHTVAHDLQNPLGVIIGFSETLQAEYATMSRERLGQYLHMLARNGRTMSNIIDELLLLAGVRKMDMEMAAIDMADVVAESQQRLAYLIDESQANVIAPDTWPLALGYAPWVEEVWVNYISNAIKYGGWPPRVELGATEQNDGMVRFWVRDNGPGLTTAERERLFTPFTRLDQFRAKGHGLGLSIVLRIVERLGGNVGVEGEKGQGSVFYFTLPGPAAQ